MSNLNWVTKACGVFLLWAMAAIALPAQTFTTLHSFDGTDGASPSANLVQGLNGKLYGTTFSGGVNGGGTIFSVTTGGVLATVYNFCAQSGCTDGSGPAAGLVQGTNGKFYGTTEFGGANNLGTVFSVTGAGVLTTLHSFNGADGKNPQSGLVQGSNGNFFGTAFSGGANGEGTVFSITPGGTLTTIYNFCALSGCIDGVGPVAGLVQGTNGMFYGTVEFGGLDDFGAVFSITASGTLTTVHSFMGADGIGPVAPLIQATNGKFYGTTRFGGANGDGSAFSITTGGVVTTLYSFCAHPSCSDGENPYAALVQGTDGNFYGTTASGGSSGIDGTVFSMTGGGALTRLHSFLGQPTDGSIPYGGLVQDTNGKFFGTTSSGGTSGVGTIYSVSVGLGPFVETQPTSGRVGAPVKILGTGLTGATSVTFNGTAATFTVVSSSEITTTVPTGATSGTVQVVTPSSGTLSSNVIFRVRP